MPTYKKADEEVADLAADLIAKFHNDRKLDQVKIDFRFAYPDLDEDHQPKNDGIRVRGVKALGLTKIRNYEQRVSELGDVVIFLDGPWWEAAKSKQQAALLDHELSHIIVKENKHGEIITDDLNRPKLKMRKHDIEFGWFKDVAQRHGNISLECEQAQSIMASDGQLFWPQLFSDEVQEKELATA